MNCSLSPNVQESLQHYALGATQAAQRGKTENPPFNTPLGGSVFAVLVAIKRCAA